MMVHSGLKASIPTEQEEMKLVIASTIIEDLRAQHPGIEQIDNERGDVWLPGGSTPQSAGCIIDVCSIAAAVEAEVRAMLAPGHTDLMISRAGDLLNRATEVANEVERGKRSKSDAVDMVRTLRDVLHARSALTGSAQG